MLSDEGYSALIEFIEVLDVDECIALSNRLQARAQWLINNREQALSEANAKYIKKQDRESKGDKNVQPTKS